MSSAAGTKKDIHFEPLARSSILLMPLLVRRMAKIFEVSVKGENKHTCRCGNDLDTELLSSRIYRPLYVNCNSSNSMKNSNFVWNKFRPRNCIMSSWMICERQVVNSWCHGARRLSCKTCRYKNCTPSLLLPPFFFNAVDCFRYGSIDRARPRIYKFPDHWPRCVRDRVIL